MSELVDAFEDTLDAAEQVKGNRETVTFRGNPIDALFYDFNVDLEPGAGGSVDTTPTKVSVRLTDCVPDPLPLEVINVRGEDCEILFFEKLEGRFDLICGHSENDMTL